ncbi:hypothetical protein [Pseudoalteromonas sp.]|uniref:hypothetical protein n=1 Tax=Pseudoalteromonas sp. TaxID=53249 RepID=UPI003563FA36
MAVSKIARMLAVVSLISSTAVFANIAEQTELKRHTFGGKVAVGNVELKSSPDEDYTYFYSYYNYKFNQTLSFEVGFNFGIAASD